MAMEGDVGQRVRRQVIQRLESLQAAGVRQLGKPGRGVARTAPTQPIAPESMTQADVASPPAPVADAGIKPNESAVRGDRIRGPTPPAGLLEVLRQEVAACVRCPHLASARTQTVFGVGNTRPRLCFFGEAPGADEDRQGEPFVGRAGQLLTKIIEACTLRREDVYILNVLKCRPPENRTPEPDEVENCRGYFERQLEILQPEFICCLGSTAAKALLKSDLTIGKLRGRFHDYRGATVICTYHPSYLLRNPAAKRDVWEDMKTLMRRMGVELA